MPPFPPLSSQHPQHSHNLAHLVVKKLHHTLDQSHRPQRVHLRPQLMRHPEEVDRVDDEACVGLHGLSDPGPVLGGRPGAEYVQELLEI